MREKKLYLYMRDNDYAKRMLKNFSAKNRLDLRVELMTERDGFWESRAGGQSDTMWLTDDIEGEKTDAGEPSSLIILDERTDIKRLKIGYVQRADDIYKDLLEIMDMKSPMQDAGAINDTGGLCVVFAPKGGGENACDVLAERSINNGRCIFVSLSEFPVFGGDTYAEGETKHLGELFFRLGGNAKEVISELTIEYGKISRLPGVIHFRDLYDVTREDVAFLAKSLVYESGFENIIILCERMDLLMAVAEFTSRVYLVGSDADYDEIYVRYIKYLRVENRENIIEKTVRFTEEI